MLKTAIDTQAEAGRIVNKAIGKPFLNDNDTLMRLGTHQQGIIFIVRDLVLRIIQLVQEQNPAEPLSLDVVREKLKTKIDIATTSTVVSLKIAIQQLIEELLSSEENAVSVE